MTLEQLRIFVAVAERQHVTRAAQALGLAQSAVSHAVAALERAHDTRLFHRVGRGVVLSEAGELLLGEARAILARVGAAEAALAEFGTLGRGRLAIHASQTIAGYWLPRHLVAFRTAHPRVELCLAVGNTAQVAEAVHAGSAELGFVEGAVDDAVLEAVVVARDRMLLVVGPAHPWAGRAQVAPGELADTEWVLREAGSGTRSVFEAALAGFGVAPGSLPVALALPSNEAVRAAVEAGLGATVISASVAAPSLEAGLLVQVGLGLPDRTYVALRHRERHASHAARALLALIGAAATPAAVVRGRGGRQG